MASVQNFMKTYDVSSLDQLAEAAAELAAQLLSRDILLLSGPMGAGKTEFVKRLVAAVSLRQLKAQGSGFKSFSLERIQEGNADQAHSHHQEGPDAPPLSVASPTYAFHHVYQTGNSSLLEVEHWDLYRLKSEEDLESIGFWDALSAAQGLTCVEWPQKVGAADWPMGRRKWSLEFSVDSATPPKRSFRVQLVG